MKQDVLHSPRARRQRVNDPEGTKRNIIEIATEEFAGKGFSRARVDDIAARTKTSKRMIYYYFGGKEGLYIGMLGIPGIPIPLDRIGGHHWVADVIYTPLETELVKGARAKGSKVMGGAGTCVHQAVESFRLFTGSAADLYGMQRTFAEAAARREKDLMAG
jgi:hypothetical protein